MCNWFLTLNFSGYCMNNLLVLPFHYLQIIDTFFFHLHIHNAIIPLMSYQYWHGIFLTGNKMAIDWVQPFLSFYDDLHSGTNSKQNFECLVLQEETLKWVRMSFEINTWKRYINFLSFALVTRPFIQANIIIMLVSFPNFLPF